MQEQELIDLAKKKLGGKDYGMFDWVEELLVGVDLLAQRPRHLRLKIAIMLNIHKDEIPYKTFHSWLDRYRKGKKAKGKPYKKTVSADRPSSSVS